MDSAPDDASSDAARGFGRFFLPGPTEVRPEVLEAMVRPVIGHRTEAMRELLSGIQPRLQRVLGTVRPVFISTSSATGLMEAAISCLCRRRVLCLVGGAFGDRFRKIAVALGREVDVLEVEWGRAETPERLREALRAAPGRWDLVTVVHSETSTGVRNPVAELAAVVREHDDVLLAVDGVTSVGGMPADFDARRLDFLLTGSQKALALPPGLAFGVASERALERARSLPARSFYFDLVDFDRRARERETTNTPAVPLLYALDHQLRRIVDAEGLAARWERHELMAQRTHEWVAETAESLGERLEVLADLPHRSPTVTAITLPTAVTGPEIVAAVARRGWTIAPGYGKLRERTIRIGHMGDHTLPRLQELLAVTGEAVQEALTGAEAAAR